MASDVCHVPGVSLCIPLSARAKSLHDAVNSVCDRLAYISLCDTLRPGATAVMKRESLDIMMKGYQGCSAMICSDEWGAHAFGVPPQESASCAL